MRGKVGWGEGPAKAILLGEHAVVYGHPALAVPLPQLRARAQARFDPTLADVAIEVAGSDLVVSLKNDPRQPLALAASLALQALRARPENLRVHLDSNIPIASGLGSGAAVSTAIMRAIVSLLGAHLPPAQLSQLVYEVEKLHHGTPSGIDNTVVVYEQPVHFRKGHPPEFLSLAAPLSLLVANSGIPSSTGQAVAAVRQARQANPAHVNALMDAVGKLVAAARQALIAGDRAALGALLNENHAVLVQLGVSSPELDALVEAAQRAGALGAKLTGAGRGGHAIALVEEDTAPQVTEALWTAGAKHVTLSHIESQIDTDVRA